MSGRRTSALLALTGALLSLHLIWSPVAQAEYGGPIMHFHGGGYGSTPELAIQAATADAEASAESMLAVGLHYTDCVPVGEPQLWERLLPNGTIRHNAEVEIACVRG